MIGRHMSEKYFERVYKNTWFTYLYEQEQYRNKYAKTAAGDDPNADQDGIASLVSESQFIEKNTSWYIESPSHPHKYFDKLDDLLLFIYQNPVFTAILPFFAGSMLHCTSRANSKAYAEILSEYE